jgi:hypothetical protein
VEKRELWGGVDMAVGWRRDGFGVEKRCLWDGVDMAVGLGWIRNY